MVRRKPLPVVLLLSAFFSGEKNSTSLIAALKVPVAPSAWQPLRTQGLFIMLFDDYGLAPGARVWINVSNALPTSAPVVVLLNRGEWASWTMGHGLLVLPTKQGLVKRFSSYLVSQWREPIKGRLIAEYNVSASRVDRYYVGILNMLRDPLMLEGEVGFENPCGEQLPMQLVHLPEAMLLASMGSAFLALVVGLVILSALRGPVPRSPSLLCLLALCLCLKSLALGLRWRFLRENSIHGEAPAWILQCFRLTAKLESTASVLFLLLTALGWRVLRPRLSAMERRGVALVTGFGLSLAFLEASQAVGDNMLAHSIIALLFYVFKVLCYLAVIVATNFNLKLIEMHIDDSPFNPQAAFLYTKQQTYIAFRRIFVAVVFQPSALLWVQLSILGTDSSEAWAGEALEELTSLLVNVAFFVILRPGPSKRGINELLRELGSSAEGFLGQDDDAGDGNAREGAEVQVALQAQELDHPSLADRSATNAADPTFQRDGDSDEGDITLSNTPYVRLAGGAEDSPS